MFASIELDNPVQSAAPHLDWDLCILCQNDTGKSLQCPNAPKRANVGAGYKSFLRQSVKIYSKLARHKFYLVYMFTCVIYFKKSNFHDNFFLIARLNSTWLHGASASTLLHVITAFCDFAAHFAI